ncbi:cation transporter [Tenacibaculum larymnensis]|uniref:Cation transporter n=1 Tax=Tenacibaculum larymnensis TaxID=2878201 RepID=A0A9X4EKN6_9FLAO|nr:cation transporter [Tenacibaculum larymnensis]MDE1205573.1 cation transporter [Tenacibaculum larymnensis]
MMKIQKILFALAFVSFLAVGCKNEAKKEEAPQEQKTAVAADSKELSLSISGMTCEIGCARKIASDLSKKEGVLEANVVFNDSIATIKYDANKTNKADLIAFVEGIGSGDMYKASETAKREADKKVCNMECCADKTEAEKASCEKECCTKTEAEKAACKEDCTMACCAETKKA